MNINLRNALDKSAEQKHEYLHQLLFYGLCQDLADLSIYKDGPKRGLYRRHVSVKEILDLESEYKTAEFTTRHPEIAAREAKAL